MGECMVELSAPERISQAPVFSRGFGGDALNLAAMAARLGSRTAYLTAVANDPFGEYLMNSWKTVGVDVSLVRRVEGFNGLYLMSMLQDGEREILYYRKDSAASKLTPNMLPQEALSNSRIFHTSSITQAISESSRLAALQAASIVKSAGGKVSFDINYRKLLWNPSQARQAVEEILPLVDFFMPSVPEDTEPLFGMDDPETVVGHFRGLGVPVVIAKAGPKGAWGGWGDHIFHWPSEASTVVDAIGAGDAFCGALLHGCLSGMELKDAGLLASVTAGLKLGRGGTAGGLPTRAEVIKALKGRVKI
jgi:2-dehydro-3-deoxygluconokinase